MKGILADINIQGHVDLLVIRMQAEPWKLFWDHRHLQYVHVADVGLVPDSLDSLVWETCQQEELVLITDNRNKNDPDSLEETIRTRNTPASLPVFTIANVPRLRASREYADRIIDTLLDSLLGIDACVAPAGCIFLERYADEPINEGSQCFPGVRKESAMSRVLLIALDSVGIDPLGADRPDSIYSQSRFLFPAGKGPDPLPLPDSPISGALVETVVADTDDPGAIECAITYTSIFSGQSALERHGLMHGLGLKEQALKDMVRADNLFQHFATPCLANAIFPMHLAFLGSLFVQDLVPTYDRRAIEMALQFDGRPVRLKGPDKYGFAELFTLGEINQNIFVYAAREAGLTLRTWDDVRCGHALTGTLTHELEARFNWPALGFAELPHRQPQEAAEILLTLSRQHDFTFYKYQLADLVSHTGKVELARSVFEVIETFVEAVLRGIDPAETVVILTSDHGHLEQVAFSRGHPKSLVPTWYFGPDAAAQVGRMRRPEGIFT